MNRTATRIARRFIAVALQPLVEKHFGSLGIDGRKLTKHIVLMMLKQVDDDLKELEPWEAGSWEFDYDRKSSEYGSIGGYDSGHYGDPEYAWDADIEYMYPDPLLADLEMEYKARDLLKTWMASFQRLTRDRLALKAAILGFLQDQEAMKVLGISVGQKVKDNLNKPKFWWDELKNEGAFWSLLYEDDDKGIEVQYADSNDLKITKIQPKTTFKVKPLSQGGFKLVLHIAIGLDAEVTEVNLTEDDGGYDGPDEPYYEEVDRYFTPRGWKPGIG